MMNGQEIGGWVLIVFGLLMVANALLSGPHAFGGRESGVALMVCTGLVLAFVGIRYIVRPTER